MASIEGSNRETRTHPRNPQLIQGTNYHGTYSSARECDSYPNLRLHTLREAVLLQHDDDPEGSAIHPGLPVSLALRVCRRVVPCESTKRFLPRSC